MRKLQIVTGCLIVLTAFVTLLSFLSPNKKKKDGFLKVNLSQIPENKFRAEVRYGRELMLNTAFYIGPGGVKGKYLGNKMNCSNCQPGSRYQSIFF